MKKLIDLAIVRARCARPTLDESRPSIFDLDQTRKRIAIAFSIAGRFTDVLGRIEPMVCKGRLDAGQYRRLSCGESDDAPRSAKRRYQYHNQIIEVRR
ncbi:hypothetical protein [Burkholderia glumae]|uniref:hypothetical protein n=1 Tax=Burkholderia glumae TaxID=337 RepID=UPI002151A699|nr:hypothetical protein [Burkholderia glumae]